MELTLVYMGPLKSQAKRGKRKNLEEKQHIRCEFHKQLKELWKRAPFKPEPQSFYKPVEAFNFVPLVLESRHEVAEINITMLRPEPPGFIVGQGGDIDNRIKTLLDSLRMPKNITELPPGAVPTGDENPFYCLMEDDKLITKLSVSTGRLLVSGKKNSYVHLLIHIQIKQLEPEWGHMMITL
jgi:hypothetical protein